MLCMWEYIDIHIYANINELTTCWDYFVWFLMAGPRRDAYVLSIKMHGSLFGGVFGGLGCFWDVFSGVCKIFTKCTKYFHLSLVSN